MQRETETPQAPVSPGEILGDKYRVERPLGSGGMGVVVLATHLTLDQKVALKFLQPSALGNPEAAVRFLQEARASGRLRGEHLTRVTDVGTLAGGLPYMVMEYLEGRDLGEILRDGGPLGLDDALDFFLQTCEAVAEAHASGVIHRDLKPSNLFVTRRPDGTPILKVLDFGISNMACIGGVDLLRVKTNAVLGSPFYMAPEQMRSARSVDPRSDLWTLGVILYELLSGRRPFPGETLPELCASVLSDPAPSVRGARPEVPEGVDRVILRCLEKSPEDRYQSAAELARALLPFAPERARICVERAARLLAASGPMTDSMPPPPIRSGPLAIGSPAPRASEAPGPRLEGRAPSPRAGPGQPERAARIALVTAALLLPLIALGVYLGQKSRAAAGAAPPSVSAPSPAGPRPRPASP